MISTFFIGGTSGVGKTTIIKSIRREQPDFNHVVAGALIKRGISRTGDEAYARPKVQDAQAANFYQEILIKEFQREDKESNWPIILDGHFVVPTEAGPSPVPSSVFVRLGIQQLFLLLGDPKDLAVRLTERPNPAQWWDGTIESLNRFQALEEQHAHFVEHETGIPLFVSRTPEMMKAAIISALEKVA